MRSGPHRWQFMAAGIAALHTLYHEGQIMRDAVAKLTLLDKNEKKDLQLEKLDCTIVCEK